jgi:hypothetical protein
MGRDDAMTFRPGVLGAHDSVKGFRVVASDGRAGRVSWASYAPGESYLVVTGKLHAVPHPQAPVEGRTLELAMAAFWRAADVPQTGGR